jgi:hypothetical protein
MKKIIITEHAEKMLIEYLLNENYDIADKVSLVVKYLDSNFFKADKDVFDKNYDIVNKALVIVKDSKGQPSKNLLTIEQLFQKLQYQYKNILLDREERDKLLWQIANDWYNNKISKNSILSNTSYGNPPKY